VRRQGFNEGHGAGYIESLVPALGAAVQDQLFALTQSLEIEKNFFGVQENVRVV
jgi:hypothetical protein